MVLQLVTCKTTLLMENLTKICLHRKIIFSFLSGCCQGLEEAQNLYSCVLETLALMDFKRLRPKRFKALFNKSPPWFESSRIRCTRMPFFVLIIFLVARWFLIYARIGSIQLMIFKTCGLLVCNILMIFIVNKTKTILFCAPTKTILKNTF